MLYVFRAKKNKSRSVIQIIQKLRRKCKVSQTFVIGRTEQKLYKLKLLNQT